MSALRFIEAHPFAVLISAVCLFFLFRGSTPKPWTESGTGARREHRAAYAKKDFEI